MKPKKIVIKHISPPHFFLTITLDKEDGKTRLGWSQIFDTVEIRNNIAKYAKDANEENFDRLEKNNDKLWSLNEMERTGGEPDVVGFNTKTGEYIFYDCSTENPKDRRSLCYDHEALEKRIEHKPKDSAVNMANAMDIELLTEEQYLELQKLGNFDLKTSSWVKTPDDIRKLGGALFCDRRYNNVFTYHNGAESYYAARGFRGVLKV